MLEIVSTFVKTDVTCVKCLENYIFAGIGGNLHVFNTNGSLLQIYNVFQSQRIYGIVPSRNVIAVYGSNRIKTIEFVNARITKVLISKECEDWILDLKWITGVDETPNVVTVLAHNYITLWTRDMISVKKIACDERCLLYSALIVNDTWPELLVCSGTVFSEVLVWKPSESPYFCPVRCRLVGHDGVIFSINYEKRLNLIVTTSDDRTLRFWNSAFRGKRISPFRTIYGHSARVFKSLIIDDLIATAGEDSVINVWNLDGSFVRKFDAHQNGVVWSLDSTGGRLVSGGGDAGVSVYPFRSDSSESELVSDGDSPKVLMLLSRGLALVNESGVLKCHLKEWTIVNVHNELKSYCVMDVSENRDLLALGGFHGHIFIYQYVMDRLVLRCSTISKSRIFSIHWLDDNVLLTSESEGKLRTWECGVEVGGEDIWYLKFTEEFLLPLSKERWATSAVSLSGRFAVGDRKGNIHLYEPGRADPVQTIKKAHNHLGITNLYSEENNLISIGRNGIVKRFSVADTLTQTTQDKLPFAWLSRILRHRQTTLILGFSGSNFIVWDHNARRILHEINCGGGHRSWDFRIDSDLVEFVYIKEKTVQRYRCTWGCMAIVNVVEGYHTKEINVVVTVPVGNGKFVMVSGGEDTTLRLGVRNVDDFGSEFRYSTILKSHLSSVRCIAVHRLVRDSYLLISAGGRAQIIVWRLDLHDSKPYRMNEMCNYYAPGAESETRIMDMTVVCKNDSNVLVAARSDGSLQFFSIDAKYELQCLCTVSYASKCLMKVEYVPVSGRDVVVSTSTDGRIAFWDITDRKYENVKPFFSLPVHQSGVNSFSYKKLENDSFLFATGGDDNAIVVNYLNIEYVDDFNVRVIKTYENSQQHGAQVTGMEIFDSYIITTSIDQNVTVLKYDCNETDLNVQVVRSYSSVIADVQGMSCFKTGRNVYVCLYGKGIEVIKVFC